MVVLRVFFAFLNINELLAILFSVKKNKKLILLFKYNSLIYMRLMVALVPLPHELITYLLLEWSLLFKLFEYVCIELFAVVLN